MLKNLIQKAIDVYGTWQTNRELLNQVLSLPPAEGIPLLQSALSSMDDAQYRELKLTLKGDILKLQYEINTEGNITGATFEQQVHNFRQSLHPHAQREKKRLQAQLQKMNQLEEVMEKIWKQQQSKPSSQNSPAPSSPPPASTNQSSQRAQNQNNEIESNPTPLSTLLDKARTGDGTALYKLADLYLNCEPQFHAEGAAYLQKAAEAENTPAIYRTGILYLTGKVIPQNTRYAEVLLSGALESDISGENAGQFGLSLLWQGEVIEGMQWLQLAVNKEAHEFAPALATCYFGNARKLVSPEKQSHPQISEFEQNFNSDEVQDELKSFALAALTSAAEHNDLTANIKLGIIYCFGLYNIDNNSSKALRHLTVAASKNHPDSFFALAHLYEHGASVKQDPAIAAAFYKKAIQLKSKYGKQAHAKLQALESTSA